MPMTPSRQDSHDEQMKSKSVTEDKDPCIPACMTTLILLQTKASEPMFAYVQPA